MKLFIPFTYIIQEKEVITKGKNGSICKSNGIAIQHCVKHFLSFIFIIEEQTAITKETKQSICKSNSIVFNIA